MGGGLENFLTTNQTIPTFNNSTGKRFDQDMLSIWESGEGRRKVVHTREQLSSVDIENTDYLMGLIFFKCITGMIFSKIGYNLGKILN